MNLLTSGSRLGHLRLAVVLACLLGIVDGASASEIDALYKAAGNGDSAQVSAFLERGVDVNGRTSNGSYALNAATVNNEIEAIRLLLARDADPNVQNIQGDTPLICATKYAGGNPATVKLLVDAGADRDIRDNRGYTALDYAKAKHQDEAITLLEGPGK